MSFFTGLQCSLCKAPFPPEALYVCDKCLGPLEATYDHDGIKKKVTRELIQSRPPSLWRYREFLPIDGTPRSGLESGFTPLVRATRLAAELGVRELYLKDDSVNHPTLSYKDRVVSVAATRAVELDLDILSCASTGNLGNSVAAHAARLGLKCYVFIPRSAGARKKSWAQPCQGRRWLRSMARTTTSIGCVPRWVTVMGGGSPISTFEATTQKEQRRTGSKSSNSSAGGTRSMLWFLSPGGTLLPRIARGFRQFREAGLLEGDLPRIHAAQAAGCAPVIRALQDGLEHPDPVKT